VREAEYHQPVLRLSEKKDVSREMYREYSDRFVGVSRDPRSCIQPPRWPALCSDIVVRNSESPRERRSDTRLPASGSFDYGNGLRKRVSDKFLFPMWATRDGNRLRARDCIIRKDSSSRRCDDARVNRASQTAAYRAFCGNF